MTNTILFRWNVRTASFFKLTSYPKQKKTQRVVQYILQRLGIVLLCILARLLISLGHLLGSSKSKILDYHIQRLIRAIQCMLNTQRMTCLAWSLHLSILIAFYTIIFMFT